RSKRDWSSDVCSSDLYIDLLDFLGYNGVEEPPMLYAPTEKDDGQMVARRKIVRERIGRNGMIAIAKIDGTVFREGGALPYGADKIGRASCRERVWRGE